MVLLLPPAPAALVLFGRALAIFSFWSAAARRRMAVRGPPGGVGDEGRATLAPEAAAPGALTGEEGRGEDIMKECDEKQIQESLQDYFGKWQYKRKERRREGKNRLSGGGCRRA